MNNLGAYNNDPKLKEFLLAEDELHRNMDSYERGDFGNPEESYEEFKGCSVGCTIKSLNDKMEAGIISAGDHQSLADYINVPVFLIHMQDWIFECCEDHEKWSGLFFSSIDVGADLSTVEKRWKEKLKEFDPDVYAYPSADVYAYAVVYAYAAYTYADVKAKMKEFFIEAIKESPQYG